MAKNKEKRKQYRRIGKCKQCGVCCLFKEGFKIVSLKDKDDLKYNKTVGFTEIKRVKSKKDRRRRNVVLGKINGCPHLILKKGKFCCNLHGKKLQPITCRDYPFSPLHPYWDYLKEFCGYRFVQVKGKNK